MRRPGAARAAQCYQCYALVSLVSHTRGAFVGDGAGGGYSPRAHTHTRSMGEIPRSKLQALAYPRAASMRIGAHTVRLCVSPLPPHH